MKSDNLSISALDSLASWVWVPDREPQLAKTNVPKYFELIVFSAENESAKKTLAPNLMFNPIIGVILGYIHKDNKR